MPVNDSTWHKVALHLSFIEATIHYVHMVPSIYKIQETQKSGLIQTTGVYILSGSAEIISDWMIR